MELKTRSSLYFRVRLQFSKLDYARVDYSQFVNAAAIRDTFCSLMFSTLP